jgi:hypothetical protein
MSYPAARISINLYDPLCRAIDAEARRTLRPRSQIIADVLLRAWPSYVRDQLVEDLGVVDAEAVGEGAELIEAEDSEGVGAIRPALAP